MSIDVINYKKPEAYTVSAFSDSDPYNGIYVVVNLPCHTLKLSKDLALEMAKEIMEALSPIAPPERGK